MKIILMGNAGAGKTTLAKGLVQVRAVPRLSLDQIAFAGSSDRLPVADSVAEARRFIQDKDGWIIEGCYADIIGPLLGECDALVFLNPGVQTCMEHCRRRPWEADKFDTSSEQQANLDNLLQWVGEYESRADEYGLQQHRQLYDSFTGRKIEFTSVVPDAVQRVLALAVS